MVMGRVSSENLFSGKRKASSTQVETTAGSRGDPRQKSEDVPFSTTRERRFGDTGIVCIQAAASTNVAT